MIRQATEQELENRLKQPDLADRLPMLKQAYDEQFDLAAGEDREKAAVRFVPRQMFIGGGYT